ncbi:MAG: penicillin-binding protein 2 [Candidatus Zixiibacteriota bacterium]|nr:MAG: penicillin-binding protein 2 [candidate division Zixibacteria bacterium]
MERHKLSLASRERIALTVIAMAMLVLVGGLTRLQIIEHSELAARSENNRIRVVPVVPRRGQVYDREGRVIIDNRPSYTVSVIPAEEVAHQTLPNLAALIGLDTTEIRRRVRKNMVSRYQPSPVKKDVPFEVVAVLEEQYEKFPGASYHMERVRLYSAGLGGESFTGHVGEVSEEELVDKAQLRLRLGSMIGKKGLERRYDQLLRGSEGTAYIEVFASGQILGAYEGREGIDALPGADLTLTIDVDIQEACTAALDTFCCGAIVAMDPRSGEILGMTSYPSYDANIFSSVIPEDVWRGIMSDSAHPLLNRPLTGQYPPGSVTKLVTVGAGLEERIITENSTFKPCCGGYQFGNRVFHCWELSGHGLLTAVHAIEESCDIYMYQLGIKLGIDLLSHYYGLCGFGRPTGIDLPGEVAGLNPNSDYYDRRYGKRKWTKGLVLNNSIGQGEILVTPLQMAQFYCGLANGGVVYRPHIVKSISYPSGTVAAISPEKSFDLPFSESTLEVLIEGLRLVVEGEHGTARSLRNELYSIGGKTGTAQNPHGNEHALFVGVAPLEVPEIVVCAVVENAGHGSEVAAPVVGQVIERYMAKAMDLDSIVVVTTGDRE